MAKEIEKKSPWYKRIFDYSHKKEEVNDDEVKENLGLQTGYGGWITPKDSVEQNYNTSKGKKVYNDVMNLLRKMSEVSSYAQIYSRANFYIIGSHAMKPISIYLSYLSGMSHLAPVGALETWQKVIISVLLALGAEMIFSKESSSMFNRSEAPITRIFGAIFGAVIAYAFLWFHMKYIDVEVANSQNQNNVNVTSGQVVTPELIKINGMINTVESSIKTEEKRVSTLNQNNADDRANIQRSIDGYIEKAEFYDKLVKQASDGTLPYKLRCKDKRGSKRVKANGKCTYVSTVTIWANGKRKKAEEKQKEKRKLTVGNSPKLAQLQAQKVKLLDQLAIEQKKTVAQKNTVSADSLEVLKILLIMVEVMSKLDLYGFLIIRLNIKRGVIDEMLPLLDKHHEQSSVVGIITQLSEMQGETLRAISGAVNNFNENIGNLNNGILVSGAMSRHAINKSTQEVINILGSPDNQSAFEKGKDGLYYPKGRAGYQPTGDKELDVDLANHMPVKHELTNEEREKRLTQYAHSKGFTDYQVHLTANVDTGFVQANKIMLNDSFNDEDTAKLLLHELAHIAGKTSEHDEAFKKGVEKVKGKEVKKHEILEFDFNIDTQRAGMLMLFFLNPYDNGDDLSPQEKAHFAKFGVWDNGLDNFKKGNIYIDSFYGALNAVSTR